NNKVLKWEEKDIADKQAQGEKQLKNYVLNMPYAQQEIEKAGGAQFIELLKNNDAGAQRKRTQIYGETYRHMTPEQQSEYLRPEKATDDQYMALKTQREEKERQERKSAELIDLIGKALKNASESNFEKDPKIQQFVSQYLSDK